MPDSIHTDQGKNSEVKVIQQICHLGVTKTRTTPYHPQSDGLVERYIIGPYSRCSALQWLMNMTGTFLSQRYFWHIEQVSRKLLEPHHFSSCLGATSISLRTFCIRYPLHHMIQLLSIPKFSRSSSKILPGCS